MIVSLFLLATFLGIYLYRNYQNVKQDMHQQAQLYFDNAFKTAEGLTFDKMMIEMKGTSFYHKRDSTVAKGMTLQKRNLTMVRIDSFDHRNLDIQAKDGQSRVLVKARNAKPSEDSMMNIKIELKGNPLNLDSTISIHGKSEIDSVKNIFAVNILKSSFDINYTFIQDSTKRGDAMNPMYNELFTGKKYYLNIDDNNMYIIKKILPDILLSFLLFFAVAFGFYRIILFYKKSQEIYDLKEDFMRNMTHELKTPLATMRVAIEALQNFKADGDTQLRAEYLSIAEAENAKLNDLVDKVLSISSQLDTSNELVEYIHLPTLLSDIMESFKLRLDQKEIQTSINQQLKNEHISVNPRILVLVIHNILDNAIKYINSSVPKISMNIVEKQDNIEIKISDNGYPISSEHANKIFEKFYRIPQGNVHDVKGHGLGLYIVQQLMKSLGGDVSLATNTNGNEFTLKLPKSRS